MLSVTSCRTSRATAGAECGAHGELALACDAAHQQQVRDVRAGDEQHERNAAEQNEERQPEIAGDPFVHRNYVAQSRSH